MREKELTGLLDLIARVLAQEPEELDSALDGLSGRRLVTLLRALAARSPLAGAYVEVGVFRGLTLTSAASAAPEKLALGIDSFATHDPEGTNRSAVLGHLERRGLARARLVDLDYEDALEDLGAYLDGQRVDTLFIDGPHDYRSQLMCLLLALPWLADDAVVVIDDCNYEHVRLATRDFLVAQPKFRLVLEAYTPCHPRNMTPPEHEAARAGFWNGVHVLVRDDDGLLPSVFPPVPRGREHQLAQHELSAQRFAEAGAAGPLLAEALRELRGLRLVVAARRLRAALRLASRTARSGSSDEFLTLNTRSRGLPLLRVSRRSSVG